MALARFLDRLTASLTAGLAFAALFVFLLGMALRALAPSLSGGWAEEATIYLVVWASLLGAADAVAKDDHVRMDAVTRLLPPRGRAVAGALAGLAAFAYCAALAWFGWLTVEFAVRMDERGPSAMRLPMAWYYAGLPCAMALCASRILLRAALRAGIPESPGLRAGGE